MKVTVIGSLERKMLDTITAESGKLTGLRFKYGFRLTFS